MPGEEDTLRLCRIGPYAAGAAKSGAADSDSAEAAAVAGRPDCAASLCAPVFAAARGARRRRLCAPVCHWQCVRARVRVTMRLCARARASHGATVLLLAAGAGVPARDSETAPFNLDSFKLHHDYKLPRGPGPGPPAHFKKLEHSEERHLAGVRDSGAGQRKPERGENSGRGDGRNRKREMQDACVLVT